MPVISRESHHIDIPAREGDEWGQRVWDVRPTVTYSGCVLDIERRTYHVPSDNAMIDSGEETVAVCWDEAQGRTVEVCIVAGRDTVWDRSATVDATDDVRRKALAYGAAQSAVRSVLQAFRYVERRRIAAREITPGVWVEVFKGRKVPKGQYFVHRMGENHFGRYLHLSTLANGMGEYHRYINPDNCRVADVASIPDPFSADVRKLAEMVRADGHYRDGWNRDALLALHDALTECGSELAQPIRCYLETVGILQTV